MNLTFYIYFSGVAETVMDKCVHLQFKKKNPSKPSSRDENKLQYDKLEAITMKYDLIRMDRYNAGGNQ